MQKSKRSVENMSQLMAAAEQQKQAADAECATLQVFYLHSMSAVYVHALNVIVQFVIVLSVHLCKILIVRRIL